MEYMKQYKSGMEQARARVRGDMRKLRRVPRIRRKCEDFTWCVRRCLWVVMEEKGVSDLYDLAESYLDVFSDQEIVCMEYAYGNFDKLGDDRAWIASALRNVILVAIDARLPYVFELLTETTPPVLWLASGEYDTPGFDIFRGGHALMQTEFIQLIANIMCYLGMAADPRWFPASISHGSRHTTCLKYMAAGSGPVCAMEEIIRAWPRYNWNYAELLEAAATGNGDPHVIQFLRQRAAQPRGARG
jgi:hypothetical protein